MAIRPSASDGQPIIRRNRRSRLGVRPDRRGHDDRRLHLRWLGYWRHLAVEAGDLSRSELAAVICVERFRTAPDSAQQMTELKAMTSSYNQRQFIEADGCATMPGNTTANRSAASAGATVHS